MIQCVIINNVEKVILVRYGELHLKGNNRGVFEKILVADIRHKLKDIKCEFKTARGRYIVSGFADEDASLIAARLCKVFGLHSISLALKCPSSVDEIFAAACELLAGKSGGFKVECNRADKSFPHTSVAFNALIGGMLLDVYPALSVDLHQPQTILSIDIREEGHSFVFCGKTLCAGGMPSGSAGHGLLLLSGGLDSPVAGYMMAKRGLKLTALHFHSYPYTNEKAQQKVHDLAKKLADYSNEIELISVCLTSIQEEIHKNCAEEYMITLLRIIMMRIAGTVANERNCGCIVNGESLGQVASQTLESIQITGAGVEIPIFRPLIGMDKQEIIDRARAIGTFDISILPFEDCCTVFLPDHPATKPSSRKVARELERIINLKELVESAINGKESVILKGCL